MKTGIFGTAVAVLLVLVLFSGVASADVRVIMRPWWPWPVVIAPVIPIVPPPPPATVIVPSKGFVDIDVRPKNARVYVDDEYKGIADDFDGVPGYLELAAGRHRITLKKEGYEPISFIVTIEPRQVVNLEMNLGRESSKSEEKVYQLETDRTGLVEVDIQPSDAAVYIDDMFYGTALQFKGSDNTIMLKSGTHVVEVVKPGYISHREKITVEDKTKLKLRITLDKKG